MEWNYVFRCRRLRQFTSLPGSQMVFRSRTAGILLQKTGFDKKQIRVASQFNYPPGILRLINQVSDVADLLPRNDAQNFGLELPKG